MELWMNVHGYEDLYEVSNFGNVRSKDRIVRGKNDTTRRISGGTVLPSVDKGYFNVKLYRENVGKNFKVHRLVLQAFEPMQDSDLYDVNHINGHKSDNSLANLEWCTRKDNLHHAVSIGLNKQSVPVQAFKGDLTISAKSIAGMYYKIRAIESIQCKEKTFKENVRRALETNGAYYGYRFAKVVTS